MRKFLATILTAYFCLTTFSLAEEALVHAEHVWTVSKVTGKAWITSKDQEKLLVTVNQQLNPGQTLITSSRTRVQLKRNDERIQVGSGTTMSLPAADTLEAGKTIINQKRGTLHLVVSKKDVRHFAVNTPFMVAAVKGTQFTVSINDTETDVRVHEGVVEVRNKYSDQTEDVTAGQSVAMSIANLLDTSVASTGNANPVRMVFMDRGEEHPEIVAQRARKRVEAEEWGNWGVAGGLGGIASYVMTFVNQLFTGVINVTLGMIEAVFSMFGATLDMENQRKWVELILAAVTVGLVIGVGAAYIAVRRKDA